MFLRYEDVGELPYREVVVTFASLWVFEQLADKWELDDNMAMENFVRQTAGVSEMGGARGYALERIAHRKLAQGGKFKVRQLDENGTKTEPVIVEFKPLPTLEFDKLEEIKVDEDAYGKPKSKSFAVVDALSFRVLGKKTDGFQMTTSHDHSPKHQRLKELLDAAGIKTCDTFCLYFVVHEDKFDDYKFQKYRKTGKGYMKARGVVKQVQQWVLLMPV